MAVIVAPYETTLTAAATAMGEAMGFLEKISPALVAEILNNIALHKGAREQRIIDRRMRKCYRVCRREKLNTVAIVAQVYLDFPDLLNDQRTAINMIIDSELNQK